MDSRIADILLVSIAAAIAILGLALWVAMLVLRTRIAYVPASPLTMVARRLLIIAPRAGDSVALGAGQAMRTLEHGGDVRVLLLGPPARLAAAARATWAEPGLDAVAIDCHDPGGALSPAAPAVCAAAARAVRDSIRRFAPDRVVIPLWEGADQARDATHLAGVFGLLASRGAPHGHGVAEDHAALEGRGARVAEAPAAALPELYEGLLHNTYRSWSVTPHRWIAHLEGLVPGRRPATPPPEPIDARPVYAQPMSDAGLRARTRMFERGAAAVAAELAAAEPAAAVSVAADADATEPPAAEPAPAPQPAPAPLPPLHEPERLQRYVPRDYTRPAHRGARVAAPCPATLAALGEVVGGTPAC